MSQQNISQKLESIDSSFSKAVNFYFKHPEHNPLTDEEKEIAIAMMGELKTLDHSWTSQSYASNHIANTSSSEVYHIAIENLKNVLNLFHALANPPKSKGKDKEQD